MTEQTMITDNTTSVYSVLQASAGQWPQRPLLNVTQGTASVYGIEAGEITYAEALQAVDNWYQKFTTAGYKAGMRVAILLENRPQFFFIWLALNRLGASVVPLNPDLRRAEFEYLIDHAEPALVIAAEKFCQQLQLAIDATDIDLQVIQLTDAVPAPRANAVVANLNNVGVDREAAVLYTSGTTGKPKGCVLANEYYLVIADWYANLDGIVSLTTDGERMITPLPVFHMNAMACSFMAMLTVGGCLTVLDRFHPRSWWQDVRESRATCLHYLGVMPSILMAAEASEEDANNDVRFGFGAGVDAKLHAAFEERFGFPLMEAWAMTETGSGACVSAHNEQPRLVGQSALGKPAEWLDWRLMDENDQPVAAGEPGELQVRRRGDKPRKGFFSEYYKNPEATAEAWKDGWFRTGDVVRQGTNDNLFFVDRRKNVIRRSGENIAAVEVESILKRHPDIEDAAVAAVADDIRGDEVFACIKTSQHTSEQANAFVQWGLEQMAYYKVPGYIAFVDSLPLTATQKVQRGELKTLAAKLVTAANTHDLRHLKKRQA